MATVKQEDWGCSAGMSEGVDDDFVGVIMNFVCSAALIFTTLHIYRHYYGKHIGAVPGMKTEFGMSMGYLFGGIVHHWFADRANDDNCASYWFYPLFSISYLTMVWSAYEWLSITEYLNVSRRDMPKLQDLKRNVKYAILAAGCLIFIGAFWCQFLSTVKMYPGKTDDCPGGNPPAMCDATFALGEGIFYFFWVVVWGLVAYEISCLDICRTIYDKAANVASPIVLFLGPGQIFVVSVGALLLYGANGEGQRIALQWYCDMRVGVTYIIAVLVSHLLSTLLMDRVLFRDAYPFSKFKKFAYDEPSDGRALKREEEEFFDL